MSVRVAWADDADGIAGIQVTAWTEQYGVELDPDEVAEAWRVSMARPGDARNRVLVALERNAVRGFAVTTPSPDPDADAVADGEIADLVVPAGFQRQGHGSRLLAAATETLRADRFVRARVWVTTTDDVRRAFLTSAGFEADGAHRELADAEGNAIKQVRLHAAL